MLFEANDRPEAMGRYIAETGATVRKTASHFGIGKSTVHKDVTNELKKRNKALYWRVQAVLKHNKEERHLRGGAATKKKYEEKKQANRCNADK